MTNKRPNRFGLKTARETSKNSSSNTPSGVQKSRNRKNTYNNQ